MVRVIFQPGADPLPPCSECDSILVWDGDNWVCPICDAQAELRKQEIRDSRRCRDCGKLGGNYMLKYEIWSSIWPTYEHDMAAIKEEHLRHGDLCFWCAEQRLGRKFRSDDFEDVPCNEIVFHFLSANVSSRRD